MDKKLMAKLIASCDSNNIVVNRIKIDLTVAILTLVENNSWTQKDMVQQLGITQTQASFLVNGRYSKFSIEWLLKLAMKSGLSIAFKVSNPKKNKGKTK